MMLALIISGDTPQESYGTENEKSWHGEFGVSQKYSGL